MPRNIRIVGFTGVKRQDSYNKAALQRASELLPENTELEIVSIDDLPAFEQGAHVPESAQRLREKLQQADAVLIASPEYKGLLPTGLKHALAWTLDADGASALAHKPVALMGVGRRSADEQQQLRQLLKEQQAQVLAGSTLYIGAHGKFDREGNLAHEETEQQMRKLLAFLVMQADERKQAASLLG
jgi:chromate reductase, NAD(P)H dehydrogenase (quinone)